MSAKKILFGPVFAYVSGLRFPWLFALTAGVFLADLVVPDLIPFADEMLLGLVTLLLGAWRQRKTGATLQKPAVDQAD